MIRRFSFANAFIYFIFILLSISILVPLWAVVSISLSDGQDIAKYGYQLIPRQWDWGAYIHIFEHPQGILESYKVTAISTFLGTFLTVWMISMCAYALSRRDFVYRKIITYFLFFTMLFSGGLVPTYILMTNYLHLQDTYAALIIPLMGSVWFLLLMRTFFLQLPVELIEAAKIDGAREFRIYLRIIIPISTPVFATVSMLQLLGYWNSWMPALLYINDERLYPLQYLLQRILRNVEELYMNLQMGMAVDAAQLANLPSESLRMAMAIVAIGPMLFVFMFFQRYFSKGLTVGSVK